MKINKRLVILLLTPLVLLLIPLVAMQFTTEIVWSLFDFIVAGVLLYGLVILIELGIRKLNENKYRILYIVGIVLIFLLLWAELAVGIFGTPIAGS
ncbi:MAG: hypothetical protein HUJ25_10160 [Crocinitomicaceae bacterium]|nr:hypothetical protein [Crocinitomicaceae bacterium]